ncbi:MAG: copper resistance protein NlpE N-terminal domain-containing protein [Flavisolibacter sp.]
MKKLGVCIWIVFFFSCNNGEQKTVTNTDTTETTSDTLQKTTSENAYAIQQKDADTIVKRTYDTEAAIKPVTERVKNPSGIYQALLPYQDSVKIEQTIKFYSNNTYQLQEKFLPERDSVVITTGTWTPSNGFIWLYNDQVVRGRYKWQGDVLQYFDPPHKKTYAMHKLNDVLENDVWKNKKEEGVVLFGIGNEPFWSIEFNNKDTISFLLSEWTNPVKMKLTETTNASDTTIYLAQNDSSQLKLMVLPYFCNDGMSDNVYQNKVQVQYNHKTYSGCGVLYK